MTLFEKLLEKAKALGLKVHENIPIHNKGYILNNDIYLSEKLKTEKEKICILAEEIAHSQVNTGNILDQDNIVNRKQEQKAHRRACNYLITIEDLIEAILYLREEANYTSVSEYLNVTEEFLHESILFFSYKYGSYTIIGNYFISFNPLNVREKYKVLK